MSKTRNTKHATFTLKADDVASALAVEPRSVRRWCREDDPCPHVKKDGVYHFDLAKVKEWCEAHGITGVQGARKGKGTDDTGEPRDGKERKLYWDARKAKVQALTAEGLVVPVSEVRSKSIRQISAVRQGLMTQPAKLAARLAHKTQREIETMLTDANRDLLTEFSEGAYQGE